MNELKFNCPHCHQRLEVPANALGRTIACPICKGRIRLPERKQESGNGAPALATLLNAAGGNTPARSGEIKFECPTCKMHYVMDAHGAGRKFKCTDCGSLILVPQPSNQTIMVSTLVATQNCATTGPIPTASDWVAKCVAGDEQAAKRLMEMGPATLSQLIAALKEERLEEPNTSRGADLITDVLVSFGAVSVRSLIARLSRSRHAYLALGRIGTDDAVKALVGELTSCNWRRAEVACVALGLADKPPVLNYLDRLANLSKTTQSGEVLLAAQTALNAIQARFSGRR